MNVRGKKILTDFMRKHANSKRALQTWVAMVEDATWQKNTDIKGFFGAASFLGNRRVVFNIKGKTYRLDVKIDYERQIVLVMRIGTHSEYDKWKF